MRSSQLLVAVTAQLMAVYAQTPTVEESNLVAARTDSSTATTHTVRVGLQHDFQPDTITANIGDIIRFNFYPKNHSVVRADFKKPCIPWELTNDPSESFFSGPIEQDTLQSPIPSWDLRVNTTDPVFFYCSAPDSCIGSKMVGVINPNDTFTLAIQKEFVNNSTFQLSPGEDFPDEGSTPDDDSTSGNGSGKHSLSGGAIAGIAIGGAAVVAIIVALVYLCGRKGGIEKGYRRSKVPTTIPPQMIEANYYDNGTKSPPPMPSPYSVTYAEPYRSASPTAWGSQMGSPHNSYMGHPSPGYAPAPYGPGMPGHEQQHLYV
ncbi:uncharacterized protein F4822DRAFT_374273 [Hypoxylon trugodes]|uniref:uncharacterized protein n=1 Tax=Hypoxylon trugodes TaxID=326681 RepID=UPI0021941B50|nr:uncharacterized protein F4822DRAFT_374273 [Hypoxylon trugodes]KAI1384817.1 hypothetical protein F4822DRAFT_374273 [Hypoxylon trugodes]